MKILLIMVTFFTLTACGEDSTSGDTRSEDSSPLTETVDSIGYGEIIFHCPISDSTCDCLYFTTTEEYETGSAETYEDGTRITPFGFVPIGTQRQEMLRAGVYTVVYDTMCSSDPTDSSFYVFAIEDGVQTIVIFD